jgi:hypothetical protein
MLQIVIKTENPPTVYLPVDEEQDDEFKEIEQQPESTLSTSTSRKKLEWQVRKGHSFANVPEGNYFGPYQSSADIYQAIKSQLPNSHSIRYTLWEEGGGRTNTGETAVICSSEGLPLKPLFVRSKGHLSCAEHALFAVYPQPQEDVVKIDASHHNRDFDIAITSLSLSSEGELRECQLWEARTGEIREAPVAIAQWIRTCLPEKLIEFQAALRAAMEKATNYHCREPYFIPSQINCAEWEGIGIKKQDYFDETGQKVRYTFSRTHHDMPIHTKGMFACPICGRASFRHSKKVDGREISRIAAQKEFLPLSAVNNAI